MEKAQMVTDETEEIGRKKNAEAESIVKLKKKVHQRDKRLRELKRETRNLVNELDDAYKELRRTQEELIIREKLGVAGGIASGIAHEMRNSLNIIGISVQYLHNKFIPGDERREFTEAIMSKVEELNSVASDLIQFARPHEPDFEKINIHEIVEQVLSLVKFKCVAHKIKVIKKFAHKLPQVMVDKKLME
ncbi:MAG: histidine kinase dimerization/phospho-acceptor domain-containing protein, partial [Candidatus Aminicenantes bacterium]